MRSAKLASCLSLSTDTWMTSNGHYSREKVYIDLPRLKASREPFKSVLKLCEFAKLATCILVLTLTLLKLLFDFRSGVRL